MNRPTFLDATFGPNLQEGAGRIILLPSELMTQSFYAKRGLCKYFVTGKTYPNKALRRFDVASHEIDRLFSWSKI